MKKIKSILVVALICAATSTISAQKPQWVGNTPKELNDTYRFVEITSAGNSLETARLAAKEQLTDDKQLLEGVRVKRNTRQKTEINKQKINGGALQEVKRDYITVDLTIDGEQYSLQANRIDEYYTLKDGVYQLHTLFQVATCENPVFDNTYITTSYGASPIAMSIIPGFGQWYKGSKTKGVCIFGAEALAVAGIIVCDNQRASYVKKSKEHPRLAKDYGDKADSWETGRNICIGVAAGIWVYNIIDAAVAKGTRRLIVKQPNGGGLSIAPFVAPESAGISLAYRF